MYQNKNKVSTTSGTWFGTTTKKAILAILFILYISIAGKSEFVNFLVLLICHFYHVDMLFRMLLVGPAPCWDWRSWWDGGLSAARYIHLDKKWKIGFLTFHISGTSWPRNLIFVVSCLSQDVPKRKWSFYDLGNMVWHNPGNGDFGHFIHYCILYSWHVEFCENLRYSEMSFLWFSYAV